MEANTETSTSEQEIKETFQCSFCPYATKYRGSLKDHINKHTMERIFKCDFCDFDTVYRNVLKDHINSIHIRAIAYKCPECEYETHTKRNLKSHVKGKHSKESLRCNLCSFVTQWEMSLRKHTVSCMAKHQLKTLMRTDGQTNKQEEVKGTRQSSLKCEFCDYTTLYLSHLKQHVNSLHTQSVVFKCTDCCYQTTNRQSLRRHIKTVHNRICDYCSFVARNKMQLKKHMRTCEFRDCPKRKNEKNEIVIPDLPMPENIIRNFRCKICDYTTIFENQFEEHLKKHTVVLKCKYCGYEAPTKYYLARHVCAVRPENDYNCDDCPFVSKSFKSFKEHAKREHQINVGSKRVYLNLVKKRQKCAYPNDVEEHVVTESTVHKCKYCDYTNSYFASLRKHLKSEHNKLNVVTYKKCKQCNYKTPSNYNLMRHANRVHQKKYFQCTLCHFKTINEKYIKIHMNKKHKLPEDEKVEGRVKTERNVEDLTAL